MFSRILRTAAAVLLLALTAGGVCGCGSKYKNDAEKQFLEAARGGDAEAQYNLGACYEFGTGGAPVDLDVAKEWYKKAAAQGHEKAKLRLKKLDPPSAAAVQEYRKRAKGKDAEAQFMLAECCEYGIGTEKDVWEALRNYRKAAKNGHAEAKKRYEELRKVLRREKAPDRAAVKRIFEAARRGDCEAQRQLARCYEFGLGVNENGAEAGAWYRNANALKKCLDAAQKGNVKAQYRMAQIYQRGLYGVKKDGELARSWQERAARSERPAVRKAPAKKTQQNRQKAKPQPGRNNQRRGR